MRPGATCEVRREEGQAVAVLADRQLRMPEALAPVLETMVNTGDGSAHHVVVCEDEHLADHVRLLLVA